MAFLVLWVAVFSFYINKCVCDPRATVAALVCANKSAAVSDREAFISNFLAALDSLTPLVGRQRYGSVIINGGSGKNNTAVYAYGECMKDLSQTDCNQCFAKSKIEILKCFPFVRLTRGGRLFLDGCYIRYDDYMFFNESLSAVDTTLCGVKDYDGGENQTLFKANVMELVRSLRLKGVANDGFYAGFVSRGGLKVHGLAQCWEFVNGTACDTCLEDSMSKIGSCPPKEEGRVLNAGCYLRYSTQKFYNRSDIATPVKDEEQSRRLATILGSTFGGVAFVLVVASISFIMKKKIMQQRRAKKKLGPLLKTVNKSELNFSYETLERAANYFSDSNKLGQGGSGTVYKGILPDGKTVAIKRLFFNTSQWVDHLFNEINLISGIHHKNLVRLLGCSITGPESLLVYEYVPNQSLDDYLFVKRNVRRLTWEERYKIILGSAEGLAYLHEESNLRIIHRDIKLSNILLDDDFTPKIADFGLCRLFPEDKSHISTAIAGTLGYMAPEYVVRGKLTEKADIYSFGVVLIEVVSGQRNNALSQNLHSILQNIWNLYRAGKLYEAVDPSLEARFQEEEASRMLEIGLLCVQAAAETRPPMSIVVKMLTGNHEIPRPTQPPFLNFKNTEFVQNKQTDTDLCQTDSYTCSSGNDLTESRIEPR